VPLVVSLREWRPDDLPAALDVLGRTHRADSYPVLWPDDPASFACPEDAVASWVGEDGNGAFVGHVCIRPAHGPPLPTWVKGSGRAADDLGVVSRLYVEPSARRHGIARLLMAHAVAAIEERGQAPVLDVLLRYKPAIRLYEGEGWARVGSFVWPMPDGSEEPAYGYALIPAGTGVSFPFKERR
jgi:ribosomal protein S18 acetylase RimI-like enzyme